MTTFNYDEILLNNILIGKKKFAEDYFYMDLRYKLNSDKIPLLIKTPSLEINDINYNVITGSYIETIILDNNFLKFLNKLDNYLISKITEKSHILFDEKKNLSYIKEIYKRNINYDNNIFLSKFNFIENKELNSTLFFNENKEKITLKELEKNKKIKIILNINSIKYINNQLNVLYIIELLKLDNNQTIYKYINSYQNVYETAGVNSIKLLENNETNIEVNKLNEKVEEDDTKLNQDNEKIYNRKIRQKIRDKINYENIGFDLTETSDDENDDNLISKIIELSRNK